MRAPTAIIRHTVRALRSQWWSAHAIRAYQERALVATMRHACTSVPFYRKLGIAPKSLHSTDDLQRFPLLTKRDIQENAADFLADGLDPANLQFSRTSGSTGEPTVTYFDDNAWALTKYALKIRRVCAATSPLFRRCMIISEQLAPDVAAYRAKRPFGSGFLYSERLVSLFDDIAEHRAVIAKYRPHMLYAFPSYLLELLRSYEEAGAGTGEPPPRIPILFTSSEILTPFARTRIEAGFRGQLFDIYGSTEFKEVAWQCRCGGYHVNFESVHVETRHHGEDRTAGSIVLSTLCNRAMPLLRFQTGDLGTLEPSACACGRHSPLLHVALGREGDMLELPSGRRLSPYTLTTLIETIPGVNQYRIRHEAPAKLRVQLIASGELTAVTLEDCRQQLLEVLREPMEISVEQVASLARRAGGKHKVFERCW